MSHRLSVSFATTLSIATVMTTEAPDTWTANDAAIRLFDRCVDHHADRQGERVHATRYKLSFRFLHKHDPRILQPGALAVLVLGGGRGVFESCLQRVQNVTLRGYDGDLSYPYCSLANHSADLILSMEGAHGRVFHLYPYCTLASGSCLTRVPPTRFLCSQSLSTSKTRQCVESARIGKAVVSSTTCGKWPGYFEQADVL